MSEFRVSVIIPVYNAAAYVTQAVESALAQTETAEVLLIEDGSPDNALEVCEELASKYEKVKLLRHPNGENRGAGASRNLGMRNARFDYIAFLDADDFFLPNRFYTTARVFTTIPNCEGVYEATGRHIEDQEGYTRWKNAGKSDETLNAMLPNILPEQLPAALIRGGFGSFHLDGFVIKNQVLSMTGFMSENLSLHQDSEFKIKAAISCKLFPGELSVPVSMVRVHKNNRISSPRSYKKINIDNLKMWESLYRWCKKYNQIEYLGMIIEKIISNVISSKGDSSWMKSKLFYPTVKFFKITHWAILHPEFLKEKAFWSVANKMLFSHS